MPPRAQIYAHMNDNTINELIAEECRMAEARTAAVKNDGEATVASIQAASRQTLSQIARIGALEGQYLNDLYGEKDAAARTEGAARENEVEGLGIAERDCITELYNRKQELAEEETRHREGEWEGLGAHEVDCIASMYRAEGEAKVQVVEQVGKVRAKEIKGVEAEEMRGMYEAEREAKVEAVEEEHKALLKELKITKEHERKCIAKMWAAESDARVRAVRTENELRMELLREESKLNMDLMRQESAARREMEALGGNESSVRSSPAVAWESSRVAGKRKRVS